VECVFEFSVLTHKHFFQLSVGSR